MLNRRNFIKMSSLAALGLMFAGCGENSAVSDGKADLVVYGKIFTSEDNKIVEAFAGKTANLFMSVISRESKVLLNRARLKLLTTRVKGL